MTRFSTGAALAALLCALAATARCAPSSGAAGTTSAAVTPTPVPQWHNPCGVLGKSGAARNALRHHGKKANKLRDWLDQVKLQFTLTQRKLERLKPRINELYGHVANLESQISISWLEFKHFEWYKNNLRKLQLKEKAGGVLQRMHTSLQTMLATVVSLQQFSPHLRKRLELFAEVRTEVNKMLCESEEALLQLNMSVPERVDGSVVSWNEQDSKPDHTDLLLMDWGVLDKLVRSVKNWMRVLDDMLGTARPKNPRRRKNNANKPRTRPARKPRRRQPAQH